MRNQSLARRRFYQLISQPEAHLPLAEAALCIAWEDQGMGAPEVALQQLDWLAEAVRSRIDQDTSPHDAVAALNSHLFETLGFRGNTWDYENPANSFLDQVLATRIGLPITLAVIYLEVGWRLGLPVAGVALPGHFLARYTQADVEIFIDPFHQGRLWSRAECEEQIVKVYGEVAPPLIETIMQPPSRRAILVRMLRNLKHTYMSWSDFAQALAAVERILLLTPDDAQEVRDRGLLRSRLGYLHRALEDLERYAALAPAAPDLPHIRTYARSLVEHITHGN